MTRDMELIRKIIAAIQARNDAGYVIMEMEGYAAPVVARHLELMEHAGLIEAVVSPYAIGDNDPSQQYPIVAVKDLTWAGHDLAGALGNETVWARLKQKVKPTDLATLPLSIVKDVAVALAGEWLKQQFGLS